MLEITKILEPVILLLILKPVVPVLALKILRILVWQGVGHWRMGTAAVCDTVLNCVSQINLIYLGNS